LKGSFDEGGSECRFNKEMTSKAVEEKTHER